MGFDGIFNMIDFFVLGFGVYAVYSAHVLQREGRIIRTFLLLKDTDMDACRDLQGYANFMSPRLRTLGGVMVAYSLISLMNTYMVEIESLFWLMMAAFLLVLFWYGAEVKKAVKRYF